MLIMFHDTHTALFVGGERV